MVHNKDYLKRDLRKTDIFRTHILKNSIEWGYLDNILKRNFF